MKTIKKPHSLLLLLAASLFAACDDTTGNLGGEVMPSQDGMQISQAVFSVATKSVAADSVLATTSTSYLGKVVDPETGSITTGDYLSEFHILENYSLPDKSLMQTDADGRVVADSADIRIYIPSYYGDSLNSMKLGVYELDTANVMPADGVFYTTLNPQQYLNRNPSAVRRELTFAVRDLALSDSAVNATTSRNRNIRIKLPRSYGSFIMNKFYENQQNFSNSYNFTRHVCPGFYFKTLSGSGTMLAVDVTTLNIYFTYTDHDTLTSGVQRLAATEEVMQNTHIENRNLQPLLADTACTYVKAPTGIYTKATLPIDQIYSNEHIDDTLNSAKVVFPRVNNTSAQTRFTLPVPANLLMVRSADLYSFFEKGRVADGVTSFLTPYSKTSNAYVFDNIAPLVAQIKNQRNKGAGITGRETEAQRRAKCAAWEAQNPGWNEVVLVPVTASYGTTGTLMRVRNDLSLSSTRLAAGQGDGPTISVVYSRFNY